MPAAQLAIRNVYCAYSSPVRSSRLQIRTALRRWPASITPPADSWLLTRWDGNEIKAAAFADAPLFAGRQPRAWRLLADPEGRRRTFIETVVGGSAAALRDFRAQLALQGRTASAAFDSIVAKGNAKPGIAIRLESISATLRGFHAETLTYATYLRASDALAQGRPDPTGASSTALEGLEIIAALPPEVRGALLPVAALRVGTTWFVASNCTARAHGMLMLAIDGGDEPRIVRAAYSTLFPGEPQ